MATCGNRAKAARHRVRMREASDPVLDDTVPAESRTAVAAPDAVILGPPPVRELR